MVYSHKNNFNWKHPLDGFWYQIYEKGNDVVIAFRGTPEPSLSSLGDWVTTVGMIATGVHPQWSDLLQEIGNQKGGIYPYLTKGKNIYITGHSLGGHLAVVAYTIINLEGIALYDFVCASVLIQR